MGGAVPTATSSTRAGSPFGLLRARSVESAGETMARALIEVLIDVMFRPLGALAAVTGGAGVRRTDGGGQRRLRKPEAMVAPIIDDHVCALRHVAIGAKAAFGAGLVEVVARVVVYRRLVAAGTEGVAFGAETSALCASWQSLQTTPAACILL